MNRIKHIALIIAITIVLNTILPANPITVYASGNDIIQSNLDIVMSVYPSGSYFSKNGKACGGSHSGCSNCKLQNVPSREGLPSGASVGADDSWTCVGFAKYVFYCLTGTAWGNSKNTIYENVACGDVYKKASLGDYGEG